MKQKNNVEFVKELMEFSKFGTLSQIFIIEAILRYANEIVENQEKVKKEMHRHFIHPDAWIGAASEIKEKFEKRKS